LGNLDGSSNVSEKCIPTGNICIDFKKFKAAICISKTPLALVGEMKRHWLKNPVVVSEIIPGAQVDSVIVMLGQRPGMRERLATQ
jgi:hypothetical protein